MGIEQAEAIFFLSFPYVIIPYKQQYFKLFVYIHIVVVKVVTTYILVDGYTSVRGNILLPSSG
jgi:hypothetical protein